MVCLRLSFRCLLMVCLQNCSGAEAPHKHTKLPMVHRSAHNRSWPCCHVVYFTACLSHTTGHSSIICHETLACICIFYGLHDRPTSPWRMLTPAIHCLAAMAALNVCGDKLPVLPLLLNARQHSEHILVLEKLQGRCTSYTCGFCNLWISLNVDLHVMHLALVLIND